MHTLWKRCDLGGEHWENDAAYGGWWRQNKGGCKSNMIAMVQCSDVGVLARLARADLLAGFLHQLHVVVQSVDPMQ